MRRALFDWHLTLGKVAAILMIVWSASGAAMILDPIVRRAVEGKLPKPRTTGLRAADFAFPVSRLPVDGAATLTLRRLGDRAWYEARRADGTAAAFDARTGSPVPAESSSADIRSAVAEMLAGSRWSVDSLTRIVAADDHYRNGEYPCYRVYLSGPGGVELYVSARDAAVLKTTTRWSRFFRWAGMGVHTWNLQAFKSAADDVRRWSLSLLVALPVFTLAVISLVLLELRKRAAAPPPPSASRPAARARGGRTAALTAVCLVLASPGRAAPAALGRTAAGAAGAPVVAVPAVRAPVSAPAAAGLRLRSDALTTTLPGTALPGNPLPAAAEESAALPAPVSSAASPVALPAADREGHLPTGADAPERPGSGLESSSVQASRPFDGGPRAYGAATADPVPAPASGSASSLPADAGGAPRTPRAEPPSPPSPGRKGLWGLYVTHGAHLLTLSGAWRVAWPLLALELAGKAGLAFIGSAGALVEMGTGLVAGMLVDRFLPRRSMAGAALLRAALAAAVVGAVQFGAAGTPFLFGAFLAHSFALTTIHIGQSTIAPQVAGPQPGALRRLNAALKIITAAVSIPGALAGGWLVGALGAPMTLLAYAATNALVLAPLYAWLLPERVAAPAAGAAPAASAAPAADPAAARPESAPQRPADRTGLWDAAKLVFSNRLLIGALVAMAGGVLLSEPLKGTTLPILAQGLAPGAAALLLGGFQAAYYSGQFAGNLALLRWGERLSNRAWILLGATGLGAFWLFVLTPVHIAFAFAATALIGLLIQPVSVVAKTVFQEEVRRIKAELLGRAMAVNNVVYRLSVSAGIAGVGWAAVSSEYGAAGTLASAYTVIGLVLVAAVGWLLRTAPPSGGEPRVDASTAAPPSPLRPPPSPPRGVAEPRAGASARDVAPARALARDAAAARLAEAGLAERLRAEGLVLWHLLRYRTRGGDKATLVLSLPPDGRPFERGSGAPSRRGELERRVTAAERGLVSEAARLLELPEDHVSVESRLIETCCGAGCQSCLPTKPAHAERWTGLPARPER